MGRSEPDADAPDDWPPEAKGEPKSEAGTLRWIVVVAAAAVGLAVHDALPGQTPAARWIAAACAAVTGGAVGLVLLNRWLAWSGPTVDADGLRDDARHEQLRLEINRLTHAQAREAVLEVIGRDAGDGDVPAGVPDDVRELARHATFLSAGLWDIALEQVFETDIDMGLPAGWVIGDDGTGHTMLVVRPDGRTFASSNDDPDYIDGEQYPSLWHGLLVAIREHVA